MSPISRTRRTLSSARSALSVLHTLPTHAILAALLGLGAAVPAALAAPPAGPELDRIAERVAQEGSVRVLIGLDVVVRPEGQIAPSAVAAQRSAIAAVQSAAASELFGGSEAKVHARFASVGFMAAEVDHEALARIRSSGRVLSIEEDRPVPPVLLQSTSMIHAGNAWAGGRTGSGWTVAVLDTGVDRNHRFLAGKVVSEACYSSTTSQSSSVCPGGVSASTGAGAGMHCNTAWPGCNHGTHVAGIVAGNAAPDGSAGVARGANLIAVQVFSYFPGYGAVMSWTSDQIRGLERVYALRNTYKIAAVNMSLGGGRHTAPCDAQSGAMKAVIDNLRSAGIATVIASGNDGYRDAISAPACISSAISVGAHCDSGPDAGACATGVGGVASYSNIAPFVSLLAPGSYIASSVPGGGFATMQGTSMAAPHVAGAWAVLRQAQPSASVTDALSWLRSHGIAVSDRRSGGSATGLPRIDLAALGNASFTLAVTRAGTGSGSVGSAPAGISCGSDCAETFAEGTTVTLNPQAAAGSRFTGWSGACTGTGACTLTMSAARNVTATFSTLPVQVQVTRSGNGSGSVTSSPTGVSCGSACTGTYAAGTLVTLTARPDSGSQFAGWSGACSGTGTCRVTATGQQTVGASFTLVPRVLTVRKAGSGLGQIRSQPAGVACSGACTASFNHGTTVTLSAVPSAGSRFTGWSGSCSGLGSCAVRMNSAVSVTATFAR